MSRSKKQNIKKKVDLLKFILVTVLMALIFFLLGSVIFFTNEKNKKDPPIESDFRQEVDVQKEIQNILFPKE